MKKSIKEEKIKNRKRLLKEILESQKNKPDTDPLIVYEQVKKTIKELEDHCKKYNLI